jgi:fucose permease
VAAGAWLAFPLALVVGCVLVAGLAAAGGFPDAPAPADGARATLPALAPGPLAALAIMAVLYAFAEGTFSNWAAVFLHEERAVDEGTATFAISGFWIGLTVGRLAISAVLGRVRAELVWLALPLAMAGVFVLLPLASGPASGIALFALAGGACSAFFPLTVGQANARYAGREALVSSVLTAALMIGVGGGSYLLGALRSMWELPTLYRVSSSYPLLAFVVGVALVVSARAPAPAAGSPKGSPS